VTLIFGKASLELTIIISVVLTFERSETQTVQ